MTLLDAWRRFPGRSCSENEWNTWIAIMEAAAVAALPIPPEDEQLADWKTMVSRFLILADQPQTSALELETCWTAGLDPLTAAYRIVEGRRSAACDDTE